ncbi:hypothetical protein HDU98_000439 [Podochytrium sp. JEL0797]|nr:hypothetical protein HDU98_000439 [Podochytrium sp. JEL0797]
MSFETYDFSADPAFASGLASITSRLASEGLPQPAIDAKIFEAKRYYFEKYVLPQQQPAAVPSELDPTSLHNEPMRNAPSADTDNDPPAYPKSFAEICHLVAQGAPIPGVRLIPTTVYDRSLASVSEVKPRPKPWETGVGGGEVVVSALADSGMQEQGERTTI